MALKIPTFGMSKKEEAMYHEELNDDEICPECEGTGVIDCPLEYGDDDTHPENCPACGGEGRCICPMCEGTGRV